jgi:hypothetical protein
MRWYRDAIFPLGVSGEASFHQMLSNMALYLRLSRSLESTGYIIQDELKYARNEEVVHQAKVYRLVNNMLATKDAMSDDALGAVVALTCYAVCHLSQFYSNSKQSLSKICLHKLAANCLTVF